MTLPTFFRTSVGGISCFLLFAQLTFAASPPPNDHLSEATAILGLPYTSTPQNVAAATLEPNESIRSCTSTASNDSVWYQYTPTTNQEVAFNTFGSNYDTVLSVWTGTTHPLVELGCNDDTSGNYQSFVHLFLSTGTTYYINIASFSGMTDENSSLVLTVNLLLPADNDNLANAIQVATLPYTSANPYLWQSQTLETSETPPSCALNGYASVWYQYTPTINQTVSFAADAPVLSIWNGTTHPLTEITCNNSMASGSPSFPLDLIAGTTYYVNLGIPDSSAGTRTLNISELTQAGNDDWANATLITTLPYEGKQQAQWASAEEQEVTSSCEWEEQQSSVWYQYTPTTDQMISLEGTTLEETVWSYPTKEMTVSVWNGTGHPLTELNCERFGSGDNTPFLLRLTAGTTYSFKVTTQPSGVLDFVLSVSPVTPPTNDNLATATVIPTLPYSNTSQEVFGSTNEDQELSSGCGESGGSVWYQYTPTQNQTVVLSGLSEWSVTVSVWTGTTHPLTELTCLGSGNLLKLTAGTTYFIKVSVPSNQKSLVSFEATEVTPPSNDDLANATVISTLPYSNTSQEVFGSTNEDQELSSGCGESGGSVWYQYTPTQNQTVVLSGLSEWSVTVSVWTGTTHPLTELTCLGSGVLLKLTAGTTYFIKVSVPSNQKSLVSFEATEVTLPSNDDLVNATVIPTLPYGHSQSTQWATAELGEVSYEQATSESCGGSWGWAYFEDSVWYQYTPDHDQLVEFDTLGSSYNTVLSIWTGTAHPLTALVCNDDEYGVFLSQANLKLTAHTTYYIRVNSGASWNGSDIGGMLNFYAQEVLPPSNDNLAQAISITSLPYIHRQNTQGASLETEEMTASCAKSETGMSVWYKYTPTTSETVRLDTQTSSYDTVLSVWTGQPLTEIACHEDLSATDSQSKLIVTLTAGTTYLMNVSGTRNDYYLPISSGNLVLTVTANDLELTSLGLANMIDALGNPVTSSTEFLGGMSVNGNAYQVEVVQNLADEVEIWGKMTVDPNHVGQTADVVVYASYQSSTLASEEYFYMVDNRYSIYVWDQNPANLMALQTVRLAPEQWQALYRGRFQVPGVLNIFWGYRLADGTVVTSGQGLQVMIHRQVSQY